MYATPEEWDPEMVTYQLEAGHMVFSIDRRSDIQESLAAVSRFLEKYFYTYETERLTVSIDLTMCRPDRRFETEEFLITDGIILKKDDRGIHVIPLEPETVKHSDERYRYRLVARIRDLGLGKIIPMFWYFKPKADPDKKKGMEKT